MDYKELIAQSFGIAVFILLSYMKQRVDSKKSYKKNEDQHKDLFKELKSLKSIVLDEQNLFDEITIQGINIINANIRLDSSIIRLLNATVREVRDFAIKYDKSYFRRGKVNLEEFIKTEALSIRSVLDILADDMFKAKVITGVSTKYSNFAGEFSDIDLVVRALIKDLIKNGLTKQGYVDLFNEFITDLLKEEIGAWYKWKELKS